MVSRHSRHVKRIHRALLWFALGLAPPLVPGADALGGPVFVDRRGDPVAGARIFLFDRVEENASLMARSEAYFETRTGFDGRPVDRLPISEGVLVVVDDGRHAPWEWREREDLPERVVFREGASLSGTFRLVAGPEGSIPLLAACASWEKSYEEWRRTVRFERCRFEQEKNRFRLSGIPETPVMVELRAPLALPWRREARANEDLQALLEPGILIQGQVEDGRGAPIAGAEIRAASGEADGTAISNHNGAFALAVRSLPIEMVAQADGYRRLSLVAQAERLDREKKIRIRLDPAFVVRGELRATCGHLPDPIRLDLGSVEGGTSPKSQALSLTAEQGKLRLEVERPGRYTVRVGGRGVRWSDPIPFEAEMQGVWDLGLIELGCGAGVRGRVVSAASGEALPRVRLLLRPKGTGILEQLRFHEAHRTSTGASGEFEILGARSGAYVLRAAGPGGLRRDEPIELEQDEVVDLGTLRLAPPVLVLGRVESRSGKPRSGVLVEALDSQGTLLEPLALATSTDDGSFEFPLSAGRYLLRARRGRTLVAQEVDVPEGEESIEVALTTREVRLLGIVRSAGEAVPGGWVEWVDAADPGLRRGKLVLQSDSAAAGGSSIHGLPESRTGTEVRADGTFEIEEAAAGRGWLDYESRAGRRHRQPVDLLDVTETFVVVDLDAPPLEGLVVEESSDSGIEATVALLSESGGRVAASPSSPLSGFSFENVESGKYRIEARAEDYATGSWPIELADERSPLRLALERAESASIRVRLRREGGEPVSWAAVALLTESGAVVRSLHTNPAGEIKFVELAAGRYLVAWSDALAGAGASGPFAVTAGEPAEADLLLGRGSDLFVECPAESCGGHLLQWAQVLTSSGVDIGFLLSGLGSARSVSSNGALRLGRLSPGAPYRVRLSIGDYQGDFTVMPGGGAITLHLP